MTDRPLPLDLPRHAAPPLARAEAPAGGGNPRALWKLKPLLPQHRTEHCEPLARTARDQVQVRIWRFHPEGPKATHRIFSALRFRLLQPRGVGDAERDRYLDGLPWRGVGADPLSR